MNVPFDRRGKHLTPGERFLNWCKGVVMVWPIIVPLTAGTVYGNSESVRKLIHGKPVPTADDIQTVGEASFEERVIASIDSILMKFDSIEKRIDRLETSGINRDGSLRSDLRALERKVKEWHE